VARELTKVHEELVRGPLRVLSAEPVLGEVVVVAGPGPAPSLEAPPAPDEDLKSIAAALARRWGTSRKVAYEALTRLERER
jgi:16S rRNA C1402 (ribose-2'-O) methylase RsmI